MNKMAYAYNTPLSEDQNIYISKPNIIKSNRISNGLFYVVFVLQIGFL